MCTHTMTAVNSKDNLPSELCNVRAGVPRSLALERYALWGSVPFLLFRPVCNPAAWYRMHSGRAPWIPHQQHCL